MKILILTPKYFPTLCGNTITVDRIKKKLEKKGIAVEVVLGEKITKKHIERSKPDLIHAFHAQKSNIKKIKGHLQENNIPYIITLTGTDVNIDIKGKKKKQEIKSILQDATYVTAFQKAMIQKVKEANITTKKVKIIPQGAPLFKKTKLSFRKKFKLKKSDYIILLVAGIRSIKDPFYAIEEVRPIAEINKDVKLIILGEIEDKKYHKKLEAHCKEKNCTFITHGKVPHDAMAHAYREANLIINTSDTESMSTALVEAQHFNKQILATDIPGNAFLPKNALFPKKKGALTKAIKKAMKNKKQQKRKQPIKDNEAASYIKLYDATLKV